MTDARRRPSATPDWAAHLNGVPTEMLLRELRERCMGPTDLPSSRLSAYLRGLDESAYSDDWVLGQYGAAGSFFTLGDLLSHLRTMLNEPCPTCGGTRLIDEPGRVIPEWCPDCGPTGDKP